MMVKGRTGGFIFADEVDFGREEPIGDEDGLLGVAYGLGHLLERVLPVHHPLGIDFLNHKIKCLAVNPKFLGYTQNVGNAYVAQGHGALEGELVDGVEAVLVDDPDPFLAFLAGDRREFAPIVGRHHLEAELVLTRRRPLGRA
jgi:hypothetical protein